MKTIAGTELRCDTCSYVAPTVEEADAHERANLDHWVQQNHTVSADS